MDSCEVYKDLFQFAHFPGKWDDFRRIAMLTYPEIWQYKEPTVSYEHGDIEALVEYLGTLHIRNAYDYERASDAHTKAMCFYFSPEYACFHTGLYTNTSKGIYMLFSKNNDKDNSQPWLFERAILDGDPGLKSLQVVPLAPSFPRPDYAQAYYAKWPIRLDGAALKKDVRIRALVSRKNCNELDMLERLKPMLANSRAKVKHKANDVPAIWHDEKLQYAMPLYLNKEDAPAYVLVLDPGESLTYTARETIATRQAYREARILGSIQTPWLCEQMKGRTAYDADQHEKGAAGSAVSC